MTTEMSRRRFIHMAGAGLAAVPAAAILAGCGSSAGSETLKVGALTPQSGPLAATGAMVANSLRVAVSQVNANRGLGGRKVEVLLRDTGAGADGSVRLYHQLVAERDLVALLWCGSPGLGQVLGDVRRRGIPVVTVFDDLASSGQLYPQGHGAGRSVFQMSPPATHLLDAMAAYAGGDRGYTSAGLIYDASLDADGTRGIKFEKAFGDAGMTLAGKQSYQTGTTDVGAQIQDLAVAAPQVLYVDGLPADVATVVEQLASSGASYLDQPTAKGVPWRPQVFGSLRAMGDGTWAAAAGGAARVGSVTATHLGALPYLPSYAVRGWLRRYLGIEPTGGEDGPADALAAVLHGIKKAGTTDRRRLVAAIETGGPISFASLPFSFGSRRHLATTQDDVVIMALEDLSGAEPTNPSYRLGKEWQSGQLYGAVPSAPTQLVRPTLAANRRAHPAVMAQILAQDLGTQCTKESGDQLSNVCKVH